MNKYEQQKANIEAAKKRKQEALKEKQKKERQKTILFSVIAAVVILSVIAAIVIPSIVKNSAIKKANREIDQLSNTVKMNVTYEDDDGIYHTGDIIIELNPEEAPITVRNFKKLVSEGFYEGITFHRVISGFMIQGGDPNGNGTGGSEKTIIGEFKANDVNNNLKHVRGTISMARQSNNYDSASSQFFIVHQTSANNSASLDGQYAAFGMVTSGMEYVDGIANMTVNGNDKPIHDAIINDITFVD